MADHQADHQNSASHNPEQAHPLSKIVSLPANLVELNQETSENGASKTSMTTNSMRKQIQFNVDEIKKTDAKANDAKTASNTTSSLHETLKQIKADEIRKRKSDGLLSTGRKRKKSKSRIDMKALKTRLEEIKKNVNKIQF